MDGPGVLSTLDGGVDQRVGRDAGGVIAVLRTFADGRLFGTRTGVGPARVLALHGWGRSHRDFDAAVGPSFGGASLDAVALDLPGFGATPPPPEVWGAAEYARCVAQVLDEMAAPVVVVGHSFGGRVAVHLAAEMPERIQALVLTGVPLLRLAPPRRPAPAYRLQRALHRAGLVSDERLERARRRYGSSDYRAASGIMRPVHSKSVAESYGPQLDAVACPVTLLWGDDDTTVPVAVAEAALARLRAGRTGDAAVLVTVQGAGHLLPLTAPGELRAAVDRYL
ncbi:MAG: alpha/beta fold hydrolase [Acidimicrobiales bacterium]